MDVQAQIESELNRIERENGVSVVYACESGSRAWGFESSDSDYDVRFIYLRHTSWYLRVMPGSDVIERPVDELLDVAGWDLKKALQLLRKSNPPLLEWLQSPIVSGGRSRPVDVGIDDEHVKGYTSYIHWRNRYGYEGAEVGQQPGIAVEQATAGGRADRRRR